MSGARYLAGGEGPSEDLRQGLALVKFTASWCGPCQEVQPAFEQLADRCLVPCWEVSVEEDFGARLAQAFRVANLPTFILLQDGQEVRRVVGARIEDVHRMLEELLEVE